MFGFGGGKSKEQIIKEGAPVDKSEFDSWTWSEKEKWFENAKKNRRRGGNDKKKDNSSSWF